MKHETLEHFSTRVEISRSLTSHIERNHLKRARRRIRLIACLTLAALGCRLVGTVEAQNSSVLQANQVVAGGETRPPSTSLQPSAAITVEAWVSTPTAVTNYPAFVSYGLDTTPYESYVLQAQTFDGTHPADFWFLTGSGTHHQVFGTTHLAPGTLYYLAATYDGATVKLYVNGSLESSAAASGSLYYPGGGLGLGRNYNRPANNFSGNVQGAAVYSAALTAAQISAHYAAGPPAPVFERSQVPSPTTVAGSSTLQPASAFTVATWFNAPATLANYPAFISYGQDSAPYESYILQAQDIDGAHPADIYFLTGSGTSHQLHGTTHLQTGTQYFVAATYDGTTASIYVNGVLENTLSASGALYYPGGGLGLARPYTDPSRSFSGTERGVAIYGKALPADRIAAEFQAGSPPTIPATLTATATSSTQINLSWSASSDVVGVTGYLIERCSGTACTNFGQIANGAATSYSDTGLTPSTSYTYRVRAVNTGNNVSDYSTTATATPGGGGGGDTQPPTAPSGLSVSGTASSANLSWTASTDNVGVTGYYIERCLGSGCATFTQIGTSTTNSYTDSGLAASTSYTYRVRSTDAAGNLSGYSNTATTTTTAGLNAPTGLIIVAAASSEIDLTWSGSGGGSGTISYLLERCSGANCSNFAQISNPSGTNYNDPSRSPTTSYSYRVRATDSTGDLSGYSGTVTYTTPSATPDCK